VRTLPVLCAFTILFATITIGLVWLLPSDANLRATFSGLLTGYAGALLMYLTGKTPPPA
jgi:hypothetical protein